MFRILTRLNRLKKSTLNSLFDLSVIMIGRATRTSTEAKPGPIKVLRPSVPGWSENGLPSLLASIPVKTVKGLPLSIVTSELNLKYRSKGTLFGVCSSNESVNRCAKCWRDSAHSLTPGASGKSVRLVDESTPPSDIVFEKV